MTELESIAAELAAMGIDPVRVLTNALKAEKAFRVRLEERGHVVDGQTFSKLYSDPDYQEAFFGALKEGRFTDSSLGPIHAPTVQIAALFHEHGPWRSAIAKSVTKRVPFWSPRLDLERRERIKAQAKEMNTPERRAEVLEMLVRQSGHPSVETFERGLKDLRKRKREGRLTQRKAKR